MKRISEILISHFLEVNALAWRKDDYWSYKDYPSMHILDNLKLP